MTEPRIRLRLGRRTYYGDSARDLAANLLAALTGHRWER